MEQSYAVQKILPDLGITNIFQDIANLTGLSKEPGLKVSEVYLVNINRQINSIIPVMFMFQVVIGTRIRVETKPISF